MKKSYLLAGLAAMMLAACSDNENDLGVTPSGSGSENVSGMLTLLGDQSDRIETATPLRSPSKWNRLHYVGSIKPTKYEKNLNWSATAVTIKDGKLYITWHSNHQDSKNPSKVWGGAIDMVNNISVVESSGDLSSARIVSAVSDTLKFNNVLVYNNNLYLSSTSAAVRGAVAVVAADLDGKTGAGEHVNVAVTPFGGNSVNAVAVKGEGAGAEIWAVSGHDEGAYGPYDNTPEAMYGFVGGKYIVYNNEIMYVLCDNPDDGAAKIINGEDGEKIIDLDVHLKSRAADAETYSLSGGWQTVTDTKNAEHYGKHVMAIAGDYAYVGTGTEKEKGEPQKNGLRVYDLKTGDCVATVGVGTTGVYVDDDYVYAATMAGLRIYRHYEKGSAAVKAKKELELLAFETKDYDKDGIPEANEDASEDSSDGDIQRHSANFVTAHDAGDDIYVYVAYGQSGVNVYKFAKADMKNLNNDEDPTGDLTTKE